MQIIGFALAIIIGLTLGLIGGGGSILTVPVLVYVLRVEPVHATAYSLFIVGLSAAVGSIAYLRRGQVRLDVALTFGFPAVIAVYATRRFLVPSIPSEICRIASFTCSRDFAIMALFALLMLLASASMIRRGRSGGIERDDDGWHGQPRGVRFYLAVLTEGIVVGTLTGVVGAGGGFLIVPALVLLAGLDMKSAVGTSLVIIAFKSLIGFTGDLGSALIIDWPVLLTFAALTVAGILLGTVTSKRVSAARLKPAFGWFVLLMGSLILVRELVGLA